VIDRPEKPLISIFTARVETEFGHSSVRKYIWHSNGNRIDDTDTVLMLVL